MIAASTRRPANRASGLARGGAGHCFPDASPTSGCRRSKCSSSALMGLTRFAGKQPSLLLRKRRSQEIEAEALNRSRREAPQLVAFSSRGCCTSAMLQQLYSITAASLPARFSGQKLGYERGHEMFCPTLTLAAGATSTSQRDCACSAASSCGRWRCDAANRLA
jgi:hypothetical protein